MSLFVREFWFMFLDTKRKTYHQQHNQSFLSHLFSNITCFLLFFPNFVLILQRIKTSLWKILVFSQSNNIVKRFINLLPLFTKKGTRTSWRSINFLCFYRHQFFHHFQLLQPNLHFPKCNNLELYRHFHSSSVFQLCIHFWNL